MFRNVSAGFSDIKFNLQYGVIYCPSFPPTTGHIISLMRNSLTLWSRNACVRPVQIRLLLWNCCTYSLRQWRHMTSPSVFSSCWHGSHVRLVKHWLSLLSHVHQRNSLSAWASARDRIARRASRCGRRCSWQQSCWNEKRTITQNSRLCPGEVSQNSCSVSSHQP